MVDDSDWTSDTVKGRRLKLFTFVLIGLVLSIIVFVILYVLVEWSLLASLSVSAPLLLIGVGIGIYSTQS
jgi:hypothetical protein